MYLYVPQAKYNILFHNSIKLIILANQRKNKIHAKPELGYVFQKNTNNENSFFGIKNVI